MSEIDEAIKEIREVVKEICVRRGVSPTVLSGGRNTKHGWAETLTFEFLER